MATPITHIVLAKELLDTQPNSFSKKDFLIGTSFPDIRHLGVIERDKTHNPEVTLNEVLNTTNSFQSGLLFHSLVDEVREKFIQDNDIYSLVPKSKYIILALKLVEDEILFHRIDNWREITEYMNVVLDEEMVFQIEKDNLKRWHTLLRDYFSRKPTKDTRERFFMAIGFNKETIEEIEKIVSLVKKNEKAMEILKNVYSDFNSLLKSQSS